MYPAISKFSTTPFSAELAMIHFSYCVPRNCSHIWHSEHLLSPWWSCTNVDMFYSRVRLKSLRNSSAQPIERSQRQIPTSVLIALRYESLFRPAQKPNLVCSCQ